MISAAYTTGLSIGLGLIVAIGAQNAFVLRQGLRREHVFAVAATCAVSDALLIAVGVGGFNRLVAAASWVDPALRYGGAAFLAWYGAESLRSAIRSTHGLTLSDQPTTGLAATLLTCLALTWLNPHVYLDTVVLLGAVSTRFPGEERVFAFGAATASAVFFFGLAYGATHLRPLFASPKSWRLLEAAIAVMMWSLAVKLVLN